MTRGSDRITIPGVRPSVGIAKNYQARIDAMIREMNADIRRVVLADYDASDFAQDASPVESLVSAMRGLRRKWLAQFDVLAPTMAAHFAKALHERSDDQLRNALRRGGMSVKFQLTPSQANILEATIHENVSLIRSIPEQHLAGVEQLVMR